MSDTYYRYLSFQTTLIFPYFEARITCFFGSTVSSSSAYNNKLENVLILQGGGSLGAFGCGVAICLIISTLKMKK
jgi:hypothetical protein